MSIEHQQPRSLSNILDFCLLVPAEICVDITLSPPVIDSDLMDSVLRSHLTRATLLC